MNHEMYLQRVLRNTFSLFDEKRCFKNEFENFPWK